MAGVRVFHQVTHHMDSVTHYKAPWSKGLIIMSAVSMLLCLGIAFGTPLLPTPKHGNWPAHYLRWLPLAFVPACVLFTIRGYTIAPGEVLVHRLLWSTRLPLAGLQSAGMDTEAMKKSIRTCGNGGFFSITGFYWNKKLGRYRAYVTDPQRAVVLRYAKRTVVISPDRPVDFARELEAAL